MYELSTSLLNLYQDCSRCFWVEIHENVRKPTTAFSSLSSGMDLAFKKYADGYRLQGHLPLELQKQIEGVFIPDEQLIKKWREEKTALRFEDKKLGVKFLGQVDDCISREVDGEQIYTPLFFKARGFGASEEGHDHHDQLKLDCYDLLLKKNSYKTGGTGYLVYYSPDEIREAGIVQFNVQVIQFVSDAERAMNLITQVVDVLNGKIPDAGKDCEYCTWGNLGVKMPRSNM